MFGRIGTFLIGMVAGAYVAQNYTIPNVADKANQVLEYVCQLEQEAKIKAQGKESAADAAGNVRK